jgi:hypothetical protein
MYAYLSVVSTAHDLRNAAAASPSPRGTTEALPSINASIMWVAEDAPVNADEAVARIMYSFSVVIGGVSKATYDYAVTACEFAYEPLLFIRNTYLAEQYVTNLICFYMYPAFLMAQIYCSHRV